MTGHLTRILATSVLTATLAGSIATPSQAMPLPVTSVHEIAGAAPTEQVRWWGGWGGTAGAATAGVGADPTMAAGPSRRVSSAG